MAGKDMIRMSQEEIRRVRVIHQAIDKRLTQVEAASILSLSNRQVRRIVKRVLEEGDSGIVHRSRGKPSHNMIPDKIRARVMDLYEERYQGFGPTLATEKLFEIDKIRLSRETLRSWLSEKGIRYRGRKRRPHRQWRQRRSYFGEMIQIDGSHHDWLEGRGPECVLMGYVDDATGNVFARFYPYEGTIPAMDSFKRYIKKYGIPISVYLDKHTTYKSTKKLSLEDQLKGVEPLSEVARAFKELGVEVIHANSPQAKGRIERQFRTFQDRLIKEMRLKGVKTIEEANRFLRYYLLIYNKRFSLKAAEELDLHRLLSGELNLDRILCVKTERALRNDFTVVHNNKFYQIKDNVRTRKVMVEDRIDGSMLISYKDSILEFKEINTRPKRIEETPKLPVLRLKTPYIPPADHPWRKFKINPQLKPYEQKEKGAQNEKKLLPTKT
ncbi:MAG: ISNCY family transposase [Anaerolineales bacterium]|nr:ISNCY family transposase [Anaerolineales bacterium]